jgi:hypoxia up-regulated 1
MIFYIPGKLKGLFGSSSPPAEDLAQDSENLPPRQEEESSSASTSPPIEQSGTSESGKKDKKNKKDKAAAALENTIPLGINVAFTTIAPMTVEEKKAARSRYDLTRISKLR